MAELRGTLTIELSGFWHAGGGKGDAWRADAVVRRDRLGLPMIAGRHLAGLIAHQLHFLVEQEHITAAVHDAVCGLPEERGKRSRFESTPGLLSVDSARLPKAWLDWFRGADKESRLSAAAQLYRTFGSTAMQDGVPKDATLRRVEVAVPLTLVAEVRLEGGDAAHKEAVELAVGLVQELGAHRSRGLGTARLSLEWEKPA